MTTPKQIIKQNERALADLRAFLAPLTERQLTEPRDAAGWSIKDHLAHVCGWRDGVGALLAGKDRYKPMGVTRDVYFNGDIDVTNEHMRRAFDSLSLKQVLAWTAKSERAYNAKIATLKPGDLKKPYRAFDSPRTDAHAGDPIINWIEGDGWKHVDEHLPWMRAIVQADRARLIAMYGQGCDLLDAALATIPRAAWPFKPSKKDWSIHEVLVHMADSECNSYLRVRKAIAQPGEAIMAYDQDVWAVALDYHQRDADDARALLRLVRKTTHAFLLTLSESDWTTRSYYHPERKGQVLLDRWLEDYAAHIPGHIEQIQRNAAQFKA
jgi:uncharacterized damage-inducible protein DinB